MRLKGEVALITGSTKGIGRAIAQKCAAEGAAVVVTGRTESAGKQVVDGIVADGGRAIFVRTDVTVEADVKAAVDAAVAEYGKLTALVNNAATMEMLTGATGGRPIDGVVRDLSTEAWNAMITMVLTSQFWGCKYAIPALTAAGGGAIVNISSIASAQAVAGSAGYSAGKAALHALTRSVAIEEAGNGIRCNCVVVGTVLHGDPAGKTVMLQSPFREALKTLQMTRLGRPQDIGNLCAFLCSHEADFITAAVIAADGGWMSKMALPPVDHLNAAFAKS